MNVCICGGGNLGHVTAGFFADQGHSVSLLTTHPEKWSQSIEIIDLQKKIYRGHLSVVSSNPQDVIPNSDIVLLCLPGFAIHGVMKEIAAFLNPKSWVGSVVSSTGFFFEAFKLLPKVNTLFGFQRVPFISRVIEYGHEAELKGYKSSLSVAIEQSCDKEKVRQVLELLFRTPIKLLDSFYEVSLSNSNPLLHTARLYTMWKDWEPGTMYDRNPEFYSEWTEEAADLLIKMDEEFQALLRKIGLKEGAIPSVLQYYDSTDAITLTNKLHSIPAFKGIFSPMIVNQYGKYEPDFSSRYFTEDFPYGMRFIIEVAKKNKFKVKLIEQVYNWGMCQISLDGSVLSL